MNAAIIITDGFEEIEAITPLDILRRGNVDVTLIGYEGTAVKGAHNLVIQTDATLADILSKDYDCVILPGGPGCYNMRGDKDLVSFVQRHFKANKLVCAICAAPLLLHDAEVLLNKRYTSHPCTHDELTSAVGEPVAVDGNLITGIGPGASTRFGFTILQHLTDTQHAKRTANSMMFSDEIF